MDWVIRHKITAETAEQFSDMFARAAAAARLRSQTRADKLEAELRAAEALDARQGDLFGDDNKPKA
jgi:hypothetical protein